MENHSSTGGSHGIGYNKTTMKINIKGKDIEVNEDKLIELIKREGLEVKSGEFEEGRIYYGINIYANIFATSWTGEGGDLEMLSINNIFHTKELAEQALERRKSIVRLWAWQKANAPFEPDWSDDEQEKFCSYYRRMSKKLDYRSYYLDQIQTELPYFATSDDVERFNNECREDILKVFNVK